MIQGQKGMLNLKNKNNEQTFKYFIKCNLYKKS